MTKDTREAFREISLGAENSAYEIIARMDEEYAGFLKGVVPHEIGHQFGLKGDDNDFGIMSTELTEKALSFVPEHLHILRCRTRSPGQDP